MGETPFVFYRYCRQLAHHMELVGSRGIRDVGTIGGNLMLRHQVNAIIIRSSWCYTNAAYIAAS